MSATTTTRSLSQEIGDLLRCRPAHDGPEHVKTAWLERKRELLAAVETVETTTPVGVAEYTAQHTPKSTTRMETTMYVVTDSAVLPLSEPCPVWCREQEHGSHRFSVGDDVLFDLRRHTAATRASDGAWTVSTVAMDAREGGGMVRAQAAITVDIDAYQELSATQAREMAAALEAAADKADAAAA
jgi:hypothetical protein